MLRQFPVDQWEALTLSTLDWESGDMNSNLSDCNNKKRLKVTKVKDGVDI